MRRLVANGLLWSIIAALVLGSAIAVGAQWVLNKHLKTSDVTAAPIDITKLSLTVVAGVGGVVALVVAYRRQRDIEQGRFVERFGAAAAQLGATDVAVRIAGVYAMAGVADESRGPRRQQCIDVLCGYLRLPYDADHGASGRTRLVVKTPRLDHGQARGETEEHVEYRQNDREVRATIVRVITDHLLPEAEHDWTASNFDFRTAHFEDADFSRATFAGTVRFGGAKFSGLAGFEGATFAGDAWFEHATFAGTAWFEHATFSGDAWFERTRFAGTAWFGSTRFADDAWFEHATFAGDAWFVGAAFSGTAMFEDAKFAGTTWLGTATFAGTARFEHTTFSGTAWFERTTFAGTAGFGGAKFAGAAVFGGVAFTMAAGFRGADFGSEAISFAGPKVWGPPAPVFDWDDDPTRKPANVEPQDWPPTVAAPPASGA